MSRLITLEPALTWASEEAAKAALADILRDGTEAWDGWVFKIDQIGPKAWVIETYDETGRYLGPI